jgi:hypothetical protein
VDLNYQKKFGLPMANVSAKLRPFKMRIVTEVTVTTNILLRLMSALFFLID